MTLINVLEIKENELIELTVAWGYEGEEFLSKAWLERKCLKPNDGTHKKLISKAKTRYNSVIYSGRGSERIYTLSEPKETPTERITGNSTNGKKATEEDEILKEYFFSELVRRVAHKENGWSETYNLWGKNWINQLSISDMEWSKFENKLKKTFGSVDKMDEKRLKEILNNIKDNLNKNTRALAIKSIERLEKENRIRTEIEFFEAIAKGSYVEAMLKDDIEEDEVIDYHNKISEKMQMRIAAEISEKLEPFEMSYTRYKVVSAFPQFGTPEEKEALKAIGEWLFDEYSIDYLYSRIRIFIIEPKSKKDISKKEAEKAFVNRIINKTNERMNRKDYKTTHKFQTAFYRLSMFMLLDIKKVEGLKEIIQSEKNKINDSVSECVFQYALKYGEKYDEPKEERTVYGFGVDSAEPVKREIPAEIKDADVIQLIEANKTEKVKVMKEVKPSGWIDIAAISTEVEPEEVVVEKDNRFAEIVEELDRGREEKRANKLDSSLMPKSGEAKFKFTGYNITELSLRGFGS